MRRWRGPVAAAALAGILGVAAASGSAAPAGDPVEVRASLGWGGQALVGHTVPAVVDLVNRGGTDLSGAVEAVNYNRFQPPPPPGSPPGAPPSGPATYTPASAYGERMDLPAGGRKRVTFFFPLAFSDRVVVRFTSGGRVLGSAEVRLPVPTGPQPAAVGVLAPDVPPALARVRLVMPDGTPRTPVVLPLTADLLPASAGEMDAFATLVVDGFDGRSLSPRQQAAVAGWVRNGGHLVLAGGAAAAGDLEVLPPGDRPFAAPEGVAQRSSWSGASAWLGAQAPGSVAAPVVAWRPSGGAAAGPLGPAADPLGWRADVGRGWVAALAFDPAQEPWRSGPAAEALWSRLLTPTAPGAYQPPLDNPVGSFAFQAWNLPADAFPGWRPVGLVLALFALLAGPATHLALGRRGRHEWAWLAVPLLAVAFAGLEYGWMKARGADVVANAVRVVDDAGDGPRSYAAIAYFSPDRGAFAARLRGVPGPLLVQVPLAQPAPPGFGGPTAPDPAAEVPFAVLRDGSGLDVEFGASSRWVARTVGFAEPDAPAPGGGLEARLRLEGREVVADVRNGTGQPLDHVTLLVGDGYQTLPSLAPGASGQLRLPVPAAAPPSGAPGPVVPPVVNLGWQIFLDPHLAGGAAAPPSARGGGGRAAGPAVGCCGPNLDPSRLTPDQRREGDLLNSWLGRLRQPLPGPVAVNVPPTVVAWSLGRAASGPWEGLPAPPYLLTLYAVHGALELPPGPFALPAGLVQPASVSTTGGMSINGGPNPLIGLAAGAEMTVSFRAPLPAGARVQSVDLDVPVYPAAAVPNAPPGVTGPPGSGRVAVPAGALEAYDFARQAWRPLAGAERFRLGPEAVGPGGEVRLRIRRESADVPPFWFAMPRVGLSGVVR